jgi:hypothetical protein
MGMALIYVFNAYHRLKFLPSFKKEITSLISDRWARWALIVFLLFSIWLNYHTFNHGQGTLRIAGGAWSDITYHHAYVRTVSIGHNVPTQYPYFANAPIHYHFMFDYYAGKLAQLGLDSVDALNIMSLLSFTVLLLLIMEFGRVYFKSIMVGMLGSIFLVLHSSLTAFTWLSQNWASDIVNKIMQRTGWLNGAQFEGWGLFNLNVFINRRNFAFSFAIIVFLVLYIYLLRTEADQPNPPKSFFAIRQRIFLGIFIGILPFWNAIAGFIGGLFLVLFAVTSYKNPKLCVSMLFSAMIAGLLIGPQLLFFRGENTVLAGYPKLHLGYALNHFTIGGFLAYYFTVLGFKSVLILFSFFLITNRERWDFLILLIPFILANVFQFGFILYDNNQLIMVWLLFANCFVAFVLVGLFKKFRGWLVLLPVVLSLSLIIAGVFDLIAVNNLGVTEIADANSPLKHWIVTQTKPESVFLSSSFIPYGDNAIVRVNLAGRKIYAVRNDVDSSCNIEPRLQNIIRIYSFQDGVAATKSLLKAEKIDYIMVDDLVRWNEDFKVNEKLISQNFKLLYNGAEADVYAVNPLVEQKEE